MSGSLGIPPISLYLTDAANETSRAATYIRSDTQDASLIAYFRKVAPSLTTPAALLKDPKALSVVLGAFNLSGSIANTAILRTLMTQDPTSKGSLAQRLGSVKYQVFANALSDWSRPPFASATNVAQIVGSYTTNVFEASAGKQAAGLANALYFTREAPSLKSVAAVQSDANLLAVVVTGLGLPLQNFEELSYNQQTSILTSKLKLGNLQKPAYVRQVAEQYLVSQQSSAATTPQPGSLAALFSNDTDNTGDALLSILNPASPDASGSAAGSGVLSLFA